jgi:hypothetical protein
LSKSITGNFVLASGSPVMNGTLYLQLSQNAATTATPAVQVSPALITITLDINGSIPSGTVIWANDELVPSGTYYRMTLNQQGGGRIYGPQPVTVTGTAPINVTNFTPGFPII